MNKREKSKVVQPHSALFKKKTFWHMATNLASWLVVGKPMREGDLDAMRDIFVYKFYYFVYKQNNIWKWKFCITFQ